MRPRPIISYYAEQRRFYINRMGNLNAKTAYQLYRFQDCDIRGCEEQVMLFKLLTLNDDAKKKDVKMLNRVIRSGGLFEYIRKMEALHA